jgi:hypothetical protein
MATTVPGSAEELLQPVHRLGVQVVGGFVEQQHVGLGQQQAAQRHAALFAAGEQADLGVPGRQAQRVGGDLELVLGVGAGRGDDGLQLGLLGGQGVKVGVFVGVGGVDLFQLALAAKTSPIASTASRTVCSGLSWGSCGR